MTLWNRVFSWLDLLAPLYSPITFYRTKKKKKLFQSKSNQQINIYDGRSGKLVAIAGYLLILRSMKYIPYLIDTFVIDIVFHWFRTIFYFSEQFFIHSEQFVINSEQYVADSE